MPAVGLEPTRPRRQQILSLPCMPFHHAGGLFYSIRKGVLCKDGCFDVNKMILVYNCLRRACSGQEEELRMKKTPILLCVFVTVFLASCGKTVQESSVNDALDTDSAVFYNGNIITMTEDKDGNPLTAEAFLVSGGKITAVGSKREVMASAGSGGVAEVDLEGKTVLPGFIDAHSHITAYAQTLSIAQLGQAETFDDIVDAMNAFLKENESKMEPGDWLVGFGYDNNNLPDKKHPTKEVLDRISTTIPVSITHTSGHMGVLNSKALEICGINASTPDPQGGKIGREPGSTEPDGYVEEKAFMACAAKTKIPDVSTDDLMIRAQNSYFRYGITTTQDARIFEKEFGILKSVADNGKLKIDVVGYVDLKDASALAAANRDMHNVYKNHFKIGGYKIFLDGSPQGRTAWLTEPYVPLNNSDPSYCGYPVYTDEEVEDFVRFSIGEGMSLHAHCNGDAAADQFINAFKKVVAETGAEDIFRPTMIHSQVIRPSQFEEMASVGITPSMFPAHVWYWGDVHLANLGEKRGMIVSAVNSAKKVGLKYTFHQDTPVIPPDMMETIWCAVVRITKNGVQLSEDEKVSVYDALKAVTANAAYEIWEEETKGTLEAGKTADFIVLDSNPLTVPPENLRDVKVLYTVKDGDLVFSADAGGN